MRSSGLRTLVDDDPDPCNRTVDLVRAGAIVIVVTGHWLVAAMWVDDGLLAGGNGLALVPAVPSPTWVAQVMPSFILVGGWAAAGSTPVRTSAGPTTKTGTDEVPQLV